jgi:Family of unknown function (DUF6188)
MTVEGPQVMKHTINEDLKSICDEIIALNLLPEEWRQLSCKTFWRASCVCSYDARYHHGEFFFSVSVFDDRHQMCDARLSLAEVLCISEGQIREIEVQTYRHEHPEDRGMFRVETDPEVLYSAINDAINVFMREVLIPQGLLDEQAYSSRESLLLQRNQIAAHWAERWRVSWKIPLAEKQGSEVALGGHLDWLIGRELTEIERQSHGLWRFRFGSEAAIRSECPWRLISAGKITLSNADDGQPFGRAVPIDAEAHCRALIGNTAICSAEVREESRDLVIGFGPGLRLEFLPLSSGYESWQVSGPGGLHIVAMGGGTLITWGRDSESAVEPEN